MVMFLTGKDIAALRQSRGQTLREFAESLGVSEATASRWESDKRRPRYPMMERLNELAAKSNCRNETATASAS